MADQRPSDAVMLSAAKWRAALYAGDASAEDWVAFTDWMEGSPDHAAAYDIVSKSEADLVDYVERYPEELLEEETVQARWQPWAIAASVVLLIVTSLSFLPAVLTSNPEPVRIATAPGEMREFEIASGLDVTLNGDTLLVQSSDDPSKFELVSGETLFAVGSGYSSGIQVTLGSLTILDRGTVFNVSTGLTEHRISVSEGAVELLTTNQTYLLEAGQVGTFDIANGGLQIEPFDPATIGSWTERRLQYTGASIDQVLSDASRIIGSDIEVGSCTIAADFAGTIQLSGDANKDVSLIADLMGCAPQTTPDGWVLVN